MSLFLVNLQSLTQEAQGRIPDFFRRGRTRLLLYFNTNKPDSFFFCRIPVVLEDRRSSRGAGGEGAHPLHPPPRSAPEAIKGFEVSLDKTDQSDRVLFFTDFTLSKLNVY